MSCPLTMCDGSGWIEEPDFTGSVMVRCACRAGQDTGPSPTDPYLWGEEPPAEVAERLALVVDGEAKARRRAQDLIHGYHNGLYW